MEITLEQARTFECVARLGTIQKAAEELNKGHTAVIYSLKVLEDQTGLKLLDRSGYRNRITAEGEAVLHHCRQLLKTRQDLADLCRTIKGGWEPSLKLIYDGVIDFHFIADALFRLDEMKAPTEVKVLSAFLHEVDELFTRENADIMVTVLPMKRFHLPSIKLKPIRMRLVAHKDHPLAAPNRKALETEDLNRHTFVRVRTSPVLIGLGTERMKFDSHFFVNDFMTKKTAILKRLGFGWLPDYLIEAELERGTLKVINSKAGREHVLHPRLYHRPENQIGKATRELLKFIRKPQNQGP